MERRVSLDALRGIAALIVLISHCVGTLPELHAAALSTVVLRPLLMGGSWVDVFFVLSGYVLYLTFDRKDQFLYLPYLAKRIARIYPPLVAAVLISLIFYLLTAPEPIPGLSEWFNTLSWNIYPTPEVVAGHLMLSDARSAQSLDNVIWSLVHEVRISILFPVLALCTRRWLLATLICSALLSSSAHIIAARMSAELPINPAATLQYVFCFAAGAALARREAALGRWMQSRQGQIGGIVIALIGVALLSFSPARLGGMLTACGAVAIVAACAVHPLVKRSLAVAPLIWVGRVSYSLYLIHLPILLLLVHNLSPAIGAPLAVALTVPVSLGCAEIFHRWIEQPSMVLGRWGSAKLRSA
ncbi:MAG: putative acyltransferase [Sphingomonas bacterium]|jgi:peptidoglycan/LPS O-acetylase OafA/YrhL|nr:putative acyltransferase [Sphingomonas bacterium]MDB5718307.1 putative acyltransferase [Sphingomonas bacterium]